MLGIPKIAAELSQLVPVLEKPCPLLNETFNGQLALVEAANWVDVCK